MTSILCGSCPLIKRKASIDTIEQKKEKKKDVFKIILLFKPSSEQSKT